MLKKIWNNYLDLLGNSFLLPTYFAKRNEILAIKLALENSKHKVVYDIGCGRQQYKNHFIKAKANYIGVDKKSTHQQFYKSKTLPDIYSDATKLKIPNSVADIVLLISIVEDTDNPELAIKEARRILKKHGELYLVTAFAYPLHDLPHDNFRLSKYYIEKIASKNKFKIKYSINEGNEFSSIICIFNAIIFYKIKETKIGKLFLITIFLPLTTILNCIGLLSEYFYKPEINRLPIHNITILQKI